MPVIARVRIRISHLKEIVISSIKEIEIIPSSMHELPLLHPDAMVGSGCSQLRSMGERVCYRAEARRPLT